MNTKTTLGLPTFVLAVTMAGPSMAAPAAPVSEFSFPLHASQADADFLRQAGATRRPGTQRDAHRPTGAVSAPTLALDTKAPGMTVFDSAPEVDVTSGTAELVASFTATDDLSGVSHGYGHAIGPSGQVVGIQFYEAFPRKKFSGTMVSGPLPALLEPGEYQFDFAYVHDVLHNSGRYEGAALAALGNTRFVVKNRGGYDAKPPTLVTGKVLTSTLSASGHQKGTANEVPRLGISLDATDSGNSAIAGVLSSQAEFCMTDESNCLFLAAEDTGQPRRASISLRLGNYLDPDTPVGDYHLRTVYLVDYAGNETKLVGTEFGGTTDFGAYFPSTIITIKP